MKVDIKTGNGTLGSVWFTAFEVRATDDGRIFVYATDIDDKPYHDEIKMTDGRAVIVIDKSP